MKKEIILYLFLICFVSCVSTKKKNFSATVKKQSLSSINKIDELKTTEDVIKFSKSIYSDFAKEKFGELQIKSNNVIVQELKNCDLYKSWNIQNWQKIDLNNDGKTELLFTAYWYSSYSQYAIIETASNNYKVFRLSNNMDYTCKIVKPITVNNKNELLVNSYKTDAESVSKEEIIHFTDTITYKFDSFIELKKKDVNYDVESIKYVCDRNFEIEIDKNHNAHYKCLNTLNVTYQKSNFYKGESTKKINLTYFNEVEKMLEYISVKDLSEEYTLDGYDFSTVWLEIKFKDGSIKKIKDYGYQGTYGLNAVYDKMTKIALEADWR